MKEQLWKTVKRQVTRDDLCGYDMSVMQMINTGANPGLFKGGGEVNFEISDALYYTGVYYIEVGRQKNTCKITHTILIIREHFCKFCLHKDTSIKLVTYSLFLIQ